MNATLTCPHCSGSIQLELSTPPKEWKPALGDTIVFLPGSEIGSTTLRPEDRTVFDQRRETRIFTYIGDHALFLAFPEGGTNLHGFPRRGIQVFLTHLRELYRNHQITHIPKETTQ